MGKDAGFASHAIVAFSATAHPDAARRFYRDGLGLCLVSEDQFALVFESNGIQFRIVNVSNVAGFAPAPFTILGWQVPEVEIMMAKLQVRGVTFQRFEALEQDELGVWTSPSGAKVAWFKDPEGNLLSISGY